MKRFVFSLVCFLLGYVAFAQHYYSGKLTQAEEWLDDDTTPALPCACRWGLETNDTTYYFTKDSILLPEGSLVIDGEKYELGEEVIVFGIAYTQIDKGGHLRFCIELLRIQRRSVGIIDKSNILPDVYWNPRNNFISIRNQWRGKSLDLELLDMKGQRMFNKKRVRNESINISFLPVGLYIYRLTSDGHLLSSGKILKSR